MQNNGQPNDDGIFHDSYWPRINNKQKTVWCYYACTPGSVPPPPKTIWYESVLYKFDLVADQISNSSDGDETKSNDALPPYTPPWQKYIPSDASSISVQ